MKQYIVNGARYVTGFPVLITFLCVVGFTYLGALSWWGIQQLDSLRLGETNLLLQWTFEWLQPLQSLTLPISDEAGPIPVLSYEGLSVFRGWVFIGILIASCWFSDHMFAKYGLLWACGFLLAGYGLLAGPFTEYSRVENSAGQWLLWALTLAYLAKWTQRIRHQHASHVAMMRERRAEKRVLRQKKRDARADAKIAAEMAKLRKLCAERGIQAPPYPPDLDLGNFATV